MFHISKGNIVKTKNFCPNPIIRYGIPDYADSKKNPKVWGTLAWQQWWEEQTYYCINGYETGGMYLTGDYYKFLNWDIVSTVGKGNHPPDFMDFQYEFFNLKEWVKQNHRGIIVPKSRRKGISEMMVSIIDSGFRFKQGYHAGICSGLQEHTDDFMLKFKRGLYTKPDEFMIHTLEENNEKLVAGWQERNLNRQWVAKGSQNTIYTGTMKTNPNIFKGKYLDDCVFEEGGEFDLLDIGYNATEPCFKDGDLMVGTPYVYGTGGNTSKGSKAFAEMVSEHKTLGLVKFFVPGRKMFFPCVVGYKDRYGNSLEEIPNLKKKYPHEWQRVGMSDEEEAHKRIVNRKAELRASKGNQKKYWDFCQNYPEEEKEVFLRFSANNFDTETLNDVNYEIDSNPLKYRVYELSWKRNDKGVLLQPLQVEWKALEIQKIEPYDSRNLIMIYKMPKPGYENIDVGGIDGYNQDQTLTSKSLGAMVIYRRNHDFEFERSLPVALIYYRPKVKEIFFETCLMASVLYDLRGNVLADAGSDLVIKYFEDNGCAKYLAPRPIEFDAPDSKQLHKWGIKFTGSSNSKPRLIGIQQKEIIDHAHKWVFPDIVNNHLDYDVNQKDSDWDAADAFMIAKARDIDMATTHKPKKENQRAKNDFELPYWIEDASGRFVDMNKVNSGEKYAKPAQDPFIRMMEQGLL